MLITAPRPANSGRARGPIGGVAWNQKMPVGIVTGSASAARASSWPPRWTSTQLGAAGWAGPTSTTGCRSGR